MILVRYVVILLGILFLLIRHQKQLTHITIFGPYLIFLSGAVLNTFYAFSLLSMKKPAHRFPFAAVQITCDTLLISALVFFTGGIFSSITSFYFAVILSASILLTRKHSIIFASLSITLLSGIHIVYATPLVQKIFDVSSLKYFDQKLQPEIIVSKVLFYAAAFYMVAILSGTLANLLRSAKILNIEILENISEGLLVVDTKGRISFFNPALRSLFELDERETARGKDAAWLFAEERLKEIQKAVKVSAGKTMETSFRKKDGEEVFLNIKISPLTDRRGTPKGKIILFENVTPHKQMEKALLRIDRYRAIVEMSAGIAHEIKNPLASIKGCAEELAQEETLSPENVRLFNIIKEESERLSNIISDFYAFLKDSPPAKRMTNLKEVILDTVNVAHQSPIFSKITFDTSRVHDDIVINIDRDQWKQVFLNLFLNAAEAFSRSISLETKVLPPEQVAFARSFVSVEEIEKGIQIYVSDTGKGIPEKVLSHIFIPFYTTKEAGIGVGLSIVNRIVRSHGGIIDVQKTGPRGTVFVITVPVYKDLARSVGRT